MSEPLVIVYQAVNRINGQRYVGMTTRGLAYRRKTHRAAATGGKSGRFTEAMREFGVDNFEFSILRECIDWKDALYTERSLIVQLQPEYNILPSGRKMALGWRHSEESKAKMRASRAGKPGPWLGKKMSQESIAKRTATRAKNPVRHWLGKKRSPETIAKIVASRPFLPPPKPPTPEVLAKRLRNMKSANEKRKRRVKCVSDGAVYDSIRAAVKNYKVSRTQLRRCLDGKVNHVSGLTFEFV